MANPKHLEILKQGVAAWNDWREAHSRVRPDLGGSDLSYAHLPAAYLEDANLSGAILRSANLRGANLAEADLRRADLSGANLAEANLVSSILDEAILRDATLAEAVLDMAVLRGADLSGARLSHARLSQADASHAVLDRADLSRTYLRKVNLKGAHLREAYLGGAYLRYADLSEAALPHTHLVAANLSDANLHRSNLCGANLERAILVETRLSEAVLSDCRVYGISAWNLQLDGAEQSSLVVSHDDEPILTVDQLQLAQFIHLLLQHGELRDVIDTITSKVVLVLGRFTEERKNVLEALRAGLRRSNYTPVLFDFERPANRDLTETISTLAHMARFVIADITNARSIPQELQKIVPDLPSVPVLPILHAGTGGYALFEHFARYPWVLPIYEYESTPTLMAALEQNVIGPARAKAEELRPAEQPTRSPDQATGDPDRS